MVFVEQSRKRALLGELFDDAAFKRVIVFTRTKRGADRVAKGLEQTGVDAAAIHGDKSQGQRERALADFKAGNVRVLGETMRSFSLRSTGWVQMDPTRLERR